MLSTHKPLDLMAAYTTEPPPVDCALPGFVAGTVGAHVSPGGSGKSYLALQVAHLIGGGVDTLGLGEMPRGRVVYLSAEDGALVLHHRLYALGGRLNSAQRIECAEHIVIQDLTPYQPDLTVLRWQEYVEAVADRTRLLIIDPLRSFHTLDENSSGDANRIVGFFRAVAARTGCTVLYLHHTSKGAARSGSGDEQHASRGSSAWVDNARWVSYLVDMTREEAEVLAEVDRSQPIGDDNRWRYVRFGVSKVNYGAKPVDRWYRRGEGGILEVVELMQVQSLCGGSRNGRA